MAIILPTSFSVQTNAHIDTRLVVSLLADRDNIAEAIRYWGMIIHVIDSTGFNDANTYILSKFHADDVITNNSNWRELATISGGDFWNTSGISKLTGDFNITRDLATDLDVSMFRILQPSGIASAPSRTDIYLGAGNGVSVPVPYGNIMIGQNNAPTLIASGEWQGGRNIFIGNDIFPTATAPANNDSTHNIAIGRAVGTGADNTQYGVFLGYEVYGNNTTAGANTDSGTVAIGLQAMYNYESKSTNANGSSGKVAIGEYALYDARDLGIDGAYGTLAIGDSAGWNTEMENYNVLVGYDAGVRSSLGRGNIAMGIFSLSDMSGAAEGNIGTGQNTYNVAIGVHALQHSFGNQNIAIGVNTFGGYSQVAPSVIGDYNVGIGGNGPKIVTGDFNSFFGAYSGARAGGTQNLVALVGDYNTFLGAGATFDDSAPIFSNSVLIASDYRQVMASNKIYIGSTTQNVIFNKVDQDDTEDQIAVIDATSGQLGWRDASTIGGGGIVAVGSAGAIQVSDGASGFADGSSLTNATASELSISGATNALRDALIITSYNTSGAGGNDLGTGLSLRAETNTASNIKELFGIRADWYNGVTAGADSRGVFRMQRAGASFDIFEIGTDRAATAKPYFEFNLDDRELTFYNNFIVDFKSSANAMYLQMDAVATTSSISMQWIARGANSGTPAAGFGVRTGYLLDNAASTSETAGYTSMEWVSTGAGTEDSAFIVETMTAGAAATEGLRVTEEGVSLGGDTSQLIKTVTLKLTDTQVKALGTTPIELIPTPGAGKFIQILGTTFFLKYGAATYSGTGNLEIETDTSNTSQGIASGFLLWSADALFNVGVESKNLKINEGIQVTASDNVTVGDSTVEIYTQYVIIDTN